MRARFVIHAAAVGLVVYLLVGQPFGAAKSAPYWTLSGHTSQNEHDPAAAGPPAPRPHLRGDHAAAVQHGWLDQHRMAPVGGRGTVVAYTSHRWPDGRRQVCTSGRVRWTAVA